MNKYFVTTASLIKMRLEGAFKNERVCMRIWRLSYIITNGRDARKVKITTWAFWLRGRGEGELDANICVYGSRGESADLFNSSIALFIQQSIYYFFYFYFFAVYFYIPFIFSFTFFSFIFSLFPCLISCILRFRLK